jgi:hypothetical protein
MEAPTLYKYTRRAHAETLAHLGIVRLGTLYNYRDEEQHAVMIGDREEGWKQITETAVDATGDTLSPFARRFIGGPNLTSNTIIRNCDFAETVECPNCWLFCTSEKLSARVMRDLDPKYDACVRLTRPVDFASIIAVELTRRGLIAEYRPEAPTAIIVRCSYRDRTLPYQQDDGAAPIGVKAPRFADQAEWRFAYLPITPPRENHIDMMLSPLTDCCELLEDIPE